jgi:hypothetical protein
LNHSATLTALATALAGAQAEIENAHKNAKNPHFKSSYADLAEIINTTKPVLTKHGLTLVQSPGFAEGIVTLETMLMHTSGEWLSGISGAPAAKLDPQGVGSALTYLRRYSMAAFCCIAQEDDDGNAASQPRTQAATQQTSRASAQPKATPAGQAPDARALQPQYDEIAKLLDTRELDPDTHSKTVMATAADGLTWEKADRIIKHLKTFPVAKASAA